MKKIFVFIAAIVIFAGCTTVDKKESALEQLIGESGKVEIKDITVPPRPRDVVCADFNDDGLMDMATTSKMAKAAVLLNKGNREFEQITYDTLIHNTSIATADIDNDGDMDFVTLTEYRFGPVFLNDGKGKFTPVDIAIPTPLMSYYISSADLNNDGLEDFVVVSEENLQVMVIFNRGNLKFEAKEFTVSLDNVRQPVVSSEGEACKDCEDSATAPPEEKISDEKAGGGLPEGLMPQPSEMSRAADEKRKPRKGHGLNKIRHFALTDLNSDGKNDIVFPVSGPAMKLGIAENTGNEDFTFRIMDVNEAEGPLSSIALIHTRGSDLPYIAVSQITPGKVFIFKNDGKGNLTLSGSFETGENPLFRMTSADIDGSGNEALIVAHGAPLPLDTKGRVQIWMQDGDGNFTLKDSFLSNGYSAYISVCEFSETEKNIILSNIHEGTITLINLR